MSRRSMLVQAVRRNTKKQTAPHIIICGGWCGHEPIVTWSLDHRKPTEAEIAAAVEKWKRERERERAKQQSHHEAAPEEGATDQGEEA